jgi:Na+:H+ antiporter, NhaA family
VAFNLGDPAAISGWAIPAATDIAFSLGVMSLLGTRVPSPLKLFLLAFAIIDDLGAIVIIAVFYTGHLSISSLLLAGACGLALVVLNRLRVMRTGAYVLVGALLWVFVLQSGVHATLAGIAVAFAVPLRPAAADGESLLRRVEHQLHPWVAYGILPLFALANAGVPLAGIGAGDIVDRVPLGIMLGLFAGKQLGIFLASWVAIHIGLARLGAGVTMRQLYAVAVLGGVGFTMSLFIGSLAFHPASSHADTSRLGILLGSLASAITGYALLRAATRRTEIAP